MSIGAHKVWRQLHPARHGGRRAPNTRSGVAGVPQIVQADLPGCPAPESGLT